MMWASIALISVAGNFSRAPASAANAGQARTPPPQPGALASRSLRSILQAEPFCRCLPLGSLGEIGSCARAVGRNNDESNAIPGSPGSLFPPPPHDLEQA